MTRTERLAARLALLKERQARRKARKKARVEQKHRKSVLKRYHRLRRAWCLEHRAELIVRKKRARLRRSVKVLLKTVRQSMGQWAEQR